MDLQVSSHGVAVAAAMAAFSCCNNWIPQYLMDLFTQCSSSSGSGCGNGNPSKWVPTPFCVAAAVAKQQQQNILHYIACYFVTAAATQCEHFGSIAAKKTLKAVAVAAPCERTLINK